MNEPLFRWVAVTWLVFSLANCATVPRLTPTEKAALREAAIVVGSRLAIAAASGALTRF